MHFREKQNGRERGARGNIQRTVPHRTGLGKKTRNNSQFSKGELDYVRRQIITDGA